MNKILTLILSVTILGFVSCGGGKDENSDVEEMKQFAETLKDLPEKAEEMEDRMNKSEEILKMRREKGDTLAMNFKELQKYLPTELPGYTANKPTGQTTNMMVFSLSEAGISFDNEAGKGKVNVKIVDFNQHAAGLMAMAFWMNGYSMENDQGFEKTFDTGIENVFGFEKFNNNNGRSEVTYSVGYRFIIEVTATDQKDTDLAKNIIKGMKIKELSKM